MVQQRYVENLCSMRFIIDTTKFVGLRYMNVYGPRQDYSGAYVAV